MSFTKDLHTFWNVLNRNRPSLQFFKAFILVLVFSALYFFLFLLETNKSFFCQNSIKIRLEVGVSKMFNSGQEVWISNVFKLQSGSNLSAFQAINRNKMKKKVENSISSHQLEPRSWPKFSPRNIQLIKELLDPLITQDISRLFRSFFEGVLCRCTLIMNINDAFEQLSTQARRAMEFYFHYWLHKVLKNWAAKQKP